MRINADENRYLHYLRAMKKIPDNLVKYLKASPDVPRLSPATQTYLELAGQPDTNIAIAADALETEAHAATRLIALANIALFARHRHSDNLHQALGNLGVRDALILSVACEVFCELRKIPVNDIDNNAFAQRACMAAAWGKALGNEFGRRDSTELLLTALIQDAGLLLIAMAAPATYAALDPLATDRKVLTRVETSTLHTDHRKLSAWLAETWQLPDHVIHTLRLGHDLAANDIPHQERGFYRAVNFCGDLAESWCRPLTAQIAERIAADAQRYLGISPDHLARLFATVASQAAQFASILGLESLTPDRCEAATQEFRDLLPASNVRTLSIHVSRGVYSPRATPPRPAPQPCLLAPEPFAVQLDEEFTLAARHDWPLSLLLVEIDDLQDMETENCLQTRNDIAALLGRNTRSSDKIANHDDNRFVILLPGTNADKAAAVAERLVDEARRVSRPVKHDDRRSATLSIGTATLDRETPFTRPGELFTAARTALEYATQAGRNRHTAYAGIRAA